MPGRTMVQWDKEGRVVDLLGLGIPRNHPEKFYEVVVGPYEGCPLISDLAKLPGRLC